METINFYQIQSNKITLIEYGEEIIFLFNLRGPVRLEKRKYSFYKDKATQFIPSLKERKILIQSFHQDSRFTWLKDIYDILRNSIDFRHKEIIFDGDNQIS